jgi:hypothetical protein
MEWMMDKSLTRVDGAMEDTAPDAGVNKQGSTWTLLDQCMQAPAMPMLMAISTVIA